MIVLYGNLRKKFGKIINSKVHSVSELMKAGEANRPGFRKFLDKDRHYVIRRGDTFKTGKDVEEKEVEMNFGEDTWHVLPLPMGRGGGGFFTTILGGILTFVGVFTGQPWLVNIGISLALSGIASMLAPAPTQPDYTTREQPDKKPSYLFNGPLNRVEAGGTIPVVYGKDVYTGSIFVSGGIEIGDVN